MREGMKQQTKGRALQRNSNMTAVPVGLWPGSEAESGAGQQKGQGWPTVGLQGLHQEGLDMNKSSDSTVPEEVPSLQGFFRVLTLLVSLYHWVKQHLKGGRIIQTCKYLHDCWIWEESLAPINSLKREHKMEMSTI